MILKSSWEWSRRVGGGMVRRPIYRVVPVDETLLREGGSRYRAQTVVADRREGIAGYRHLYPWA